MLQVSKLQEIINNLAELFYFVMPFLEAFAAISGRRRVWARGAEGGFMLCSRVTDRPNAQEISEQKRLISAESTCLPNTRMP
jgi:hypothetical protein